MKKITAVYIRHNTEDAENDDNIIRQKSACMKCLKTLDINDYQEYCDTCSNIKVKNRPEFNRMMKDIYSGCIDSVITYSADRISRNTDEFYSIIEELKNHGVGFYIGDTDITTDKVFHMVEYLNKEA